MRLASCPALVAALLCSSAFAQTCFETNYGTNLGLSQNSVAAAIPLGFTFPGPAGPVTAIDISSNGFVWLAPNPNPDFDGDATNFVTDLPRIAALFTNLDPTRGNGVFFRSIPGIGGALSVAVITWDCPVSSFPSPPSALVQLRLFSDGSIVIAHGPGIDTSYFQPLVGVTEGNGATPFQVDFSTLAVTPVNSGASPTVYDWMQTGTQSTYDLAGHSFVFVPNMQHGYVVLERASCRFADFLTYGAGCPQPPTFYELFQQGANPVDLTNHSILFTLNGAGSYSAQQGSNNYFTGFTNHLQIADDQVLGPYQLPFPFLHSGGQTNAIDVCSNGCIYLNAGVNQNSRCCAGDPATFVAEDSSIAALWMDLYPPGAAAGGGVYFDVDPANQAAYVTWNRVPEYGAASSLNTFQVALFANGTFELRYHTVANVAHDALVGYTVGNGSPDPGSRDLTALPWSMGSSGMPLTMRAAGGSRPVLGSAFSLTTNNFPATTAFGFLVIAFQPANLDLAAYGAPGCTGYLDTLTPGGSTAVTFPVVGSSGTFSLGVPNDPTLIGFTAFCQAAGPAPNNPLGFIFSNGGQMVLGR